jgi:hypothetical protein
MGVLQSWGMLIKCPQDKPTRYDYYSTTITTLLLSSRPSRDVLYRCYLGTYRYPLIAVLQRCLVRVSSYRNVFSGVLRGLLKMCILWSDVVQGCHPRLSQRESSTRPSGVSSLQNCLQGVPQGCQCPYTVDFFQGCPLRWNSLHFNYSYKKKNFLILGRWGKRSRHLFSLDVHFYSLAMDSNCLLNSSGAAMLPGLGKIWEKNRPNFKTLSLYRPYITISVRQNRSYVDV